MSLTETDVDKTLPKFILKKLAHTGNFLIRRIISEKKNIYIYAIMLYNAIIYIYMYIWYNADNT